MAPENWLLQNLETPLLLYSYEFLNAFKENKRSPLAATVFRDILIYFFIF